MTIRCQRARRRISLSSEEKENYKNNIGDEMDLDQAGNDKNPLQLWEEGVGRSYERQLKWVSLHIYKNLACRVTIYFLLLPTRFLSNFSSTLQNVAQLPSRFSSNWLCFRFLFFSYGIYPYQDLQPLLLSHLSCWRWSAFIVIPCMMSLVPKMGCAVSIGLKILLDGNISLSRFAASFVLTSLLKDATIAFISTVSVI